VYVKDIMLKNKIMAKREFLREYIMRSTEKILLGKGSKNYRERRHKSIILFINT